MGHGIDCPMACGISVPSPSIKPMSPALEGRFLATKLSESLDETRGDEMGASGHQYTEEAKLVGFTQLYSIASY